MAKEGKVVIELRQSLDERSTELESLKKKLNRDLPINNTLQELKTSPSTPQSPSKYDLSTAREEITGLKLVQSHQKLVDY